MEVEDNTENASKSVESAAEESSYRLLNVYVEVRLKQETSIYMYCKRYCIVEAKKSRERIYQAILKAEFAQNWKKLKFTGALAEFSDMIDEVVVCSSSDPDGAEIQLNKDVLLESSLHFYHLKRSGSETQQLSSNDETCASRTWELPCLEFDHMWENLIFEDNIKNDLLDYVAAMLHISDLGVDTSILRINRLILLSGLFTNFYGFEGPPGTGKTSLCKSLAQKLSIQLNDRYKRTIFIEINSHSLFSKWYSESGKMVLKMFDQIEEISEDGRSFVVILIDEVESLSMTRKGTMVRNEPMDSVRVVNALLTQLDRIRRLPNIVLLATSNLNEVIDEAFIDRADICRWIGKPSVSAVFHILASCVEEMQRVYLLLILIPKILDLFII
uniref:AAA domain-containing protein n=1 Tax=Syphacia muris TaxID=451379 RepID=A0A0N5AQH1_9BILA